MANGVFPIMDLPEDLFVKILKMSFGDRPPHLLHKRRRRERGYTYWRLGPPVTYARVCKSWEKIVYSTPLLWSSVQLNSNHFRIGDAILKILSDWMSRAGTSPLTIELQMETPLEPRFHRNLDVIMALIELFYIRTIRHLTVVFPQWSSPSYIHRRISVACGNAPMLESLTLKVPGRREPTIPGDTGCMISLSGGSPKLKTLHCSPFPHLVRILAPHTQLTAVDLGDHGEKMEAILDALKNVPNVKKLRIALDFYHCTPHEEPLELSELEELSVSYAKPWASIFEGWKEDMTWDDFFSRIRAPTLSKLIVIGNFSLSQNRRQENQWTNFDLFLANSSYPPILELSLFEVIIGGGHLRSSLSMIPSLATLKLARLRCTDDIFDALYVSPGSPGARKIHCICPHLQDIRIEILEGSTYRQSHVARLIYTRCRAPAIKDSYSKPKSIAINKVDGAVVMSLRAKFSRYAEIQTLDIVGHDDAYRIMGYTCSEVSGNGYTLWLTKD
ncbi:hypothetical protein SCHPADRAFT_999754 [Schizopora paradoxa]|uniref:F-box domain-containing protein n=1 Tax=Schizopora paradoxa TaxID=27342 RepID=A0A0H2RE88_9AGAM|nr:hypothetical protein SCHPADRAFT_999754 [Schizopora paradoxa]